MMIHSMDEFYNLCKSLTLTLFHKIVISQKVTKSRFHYRQFIDQLTLIYCVYHSQWNVIFIYNFVSLSFARLQIESKVTYM